MGRFQVVLADPPWAFKDATCRGAAEHHYRTTSLEDLKRMRVADLCAPDAALFMWASYALLPEALELIAAWGFRYRTLAFQWVKSCRKSTDKLFMGTGRWTRSNTEPCLLAVRGAPKRMAADVRQVVWAPVGQHSAKPPEVRERIVRLMGDVPRVELFARERTPGWHGFGNEYPSEVLANDGAVVG